MRITRPQMFMEMAHTVAKRSTCMRLNVGAVVVHDRRIVSIGYNGSPPGEPHCSGNDCEGRNHCKLTTHAEVNALNYVPKGVIFEKPLDLYVTDSPCSECFDALSGGPVGRIFFGTPYRITEHLTNTLWGPEVYRVLPAGYVVNWNTMELVDVPS